MADSFASDISTIERMKCVPTILEVVCRTTGLGFAAVARVTQDRWIACAVRDEISFGLQPGGELEVASTLCNEIRAHREPIVIEHVAEDPRYCDHHTPRRYGFQSYISFPIYRPDGELFGTLCAIDPKPALLKTPATLGMFELFAQLICRNMDLQDRAEESERALQAEREHSQLRERFIGVLGHDIRNPLAAIISAAHVLPKLSSTPAATQMTRIIQRSASRIRELVETMLDLARGRQGGGIKASPRPADDLPDRLQQVIQEMQAAAPSHTILGDIRIGSVVVCDSHRIEQLLSNLISNGLTHGAQAGTIEVRASADEHNFELSVTNRGRAIPADRLSTIFKPFESGAVGANANGLGLGLYICNEIAHAHHGTLSVASTDERTCFTLRIPRDGSSASAPTSIFKGTGTA
jgi:signal transduction histidine kinase